MPSSGSTWFYSHSSSVTQELLSFQFRNQESEVKVLVAHLCLTDWDCVDCSPPGSFVHGILQARILEWAAISFCRGSSQPRDWNWVSCIAGRFYTLWATREADTAYLQGKLIRIKKTFKGSSPLANPNSISGDLSQEFKRYKVFWTKMFISLLFIIV